MKRVNVPSRSDNGVKKDKTVLDVCRDSWKYKVVGNKKYSNKK